MTLDLCNLPTIFGSSAGLGDEVWPKFAGEMAEWPKAPDC
jgi:hypothetical protein